MPLRDHFRSPLDDKRSWDELHGGWPMVIVQHLVRTLPDGYFAAPGVHLGTIFEVDIATFADAHAGTVDGGVPTGGSELGAVGTATVAPPKPSLTLQPRLPDRDEYEIRVYDERKGRRLVAAIELISPSNKDRPEARGAFVSKIATLLRQGVCVSLVDVVSTRQFNLYSELLTLLDGTDAMLGADPPALYAATVRYRREKRNVLLDAWYHPLQIGAPMPSLFVWLNGNQSITLELEQTYEATCKDLRIK
jgi:hypothetical protein